MTVETVPARRGVRAFAASRPAAPALAAALIVAAFVAWTLLMRYVVAPWIVPDEIEYASVSRSFLSTGHYLFREHSQAIPSIYPALISPAWIPGSVHTAYGILKTINCALMAAGAIPLYLWARRLTVSLWALLPVVLYLAMPGLVYSGEILTENAYLPALMLALFAIALALERPTLVTQVFALGAIVLAVAARIQGLVLFVVLPIAITLALVLDAVAAVPGERRALVRRRLRRFWPSLGALALGLVLYVLYELARGKSLSSGLGIYQEVSQAHYSTAAVLRWFVYSLCELSFAVALVPVSALVVLYALACRRETAPRPAERAFLAVAGPALICIALEVGAFASHFSLRVEERYMFSTFPLLFLALAVWLARGLPRPAGATAVGVLLPVALLLMLPFESLISTPAFFTDTFGLIPLFKLTTVLSGNTADVRILIGVGALVATVLFASLPRSWARVLVPVAVAGFLVVSTGSVFAEVTFLSQSTLHAGGLSGEPSWIDRAVGRHARVELLYTPDIDADQHVLYQTEFWNRSVRRVYSVTAPVPSISDLTAPLDPATGRIRPELPAGPDSSPRYVVAASTVNVAGTRIAGAGILALYRVTPPLRLATLTSGLTPDNWTTPSASYTRYVGAPSGSQVIVSVSRPPLTGPPPATVTVTVGRLGTAAGSPTISRVWAHRTFVLADGKSHQFRIPLRRGPFQVQLEATPPFTPSAYGLTDTRTLGVQASFTLVR